MNYNFKNTMKQNLIGKRLLSCSSISFKGDGTIDAEYYESINLPVPKLGLVIKKVYMVCIDREPMIRLVFDEPDMESQLDVYYDDDLVLESS